MIPFRTLRTKLMMAILLGTTVPLLVLSIHNLSTYERAFRELGVSQARERAHVAAQRIDAVLRLTSTTLFLQGRDLQFIDWTSKLIVSNVADSAELDFYRRKLETRLSRFLEFNQGWRRIRLFGTEGEELIRIEKSDQGPIEIRRYLREAAEDITIFFGAQRVPRTPHLWPWRDVEGALMLSCSLAFPLTGGDNNAVIAADIDLAALTSGPPVGDTSRGAVQGVLMDAPNQQIGRINRDFQPDPIAEIKPEWRPLFDAETPRAVQTESGAFLAFAAFEMPLKDINWEGAGRPRWILVQETPARALFAPLSLSKRVFLFVLGGAFLAALVIALVLARGIARPLIELRDGAEVIAEGNWKHRIPVRSREEVGQLASAFNRMAEKLENVYETQEQTIELKTSELRDANAALVRDNEKRKRLEAQLIQAEKLSSIGLLASSVAHEINNPMGIISMHGQMILKKAEQGEIDRTKIQSILEQCDRVASITRSLLHLARPRPSQFDEVDVVEVLTPILGLVEIRLKKVGVSLDLDTGARSGFKKRVMVWGDGGQLSQVFLNLILNAQQAMEKGGVLTIKIKELEEADLGPVVAVIFRDTGKGIPAENLSRLFEPFYTTKSSSQGSGLGLAVSAGIVKGHGGRIEVESVEGKGASFTVLLPKTRNRDQE